MFEIEPKINDNFLSKTYYVEILNLLTSHDFSWSYSDNISFPKEHPNADKNNNLQDYGFSQIFWDKGNRRLESEHSSFITPLIYKIMDTVECDFILRARADMVTWSKDRYIHPAHSDFSDPNIASVFYVNETDGDTILYNIKPDDAPKDKVLKEYKRVSPKPNRLLIFDGSLLHTGSNPTKYKNRILINSNYIKQEYVDHLHNKAKQG